jgi:hypothetical protein
MKKLMIVVASVLLVGACSRSTPDASGAMAAQTAAPDPTSAAVADPSQTPPADAGAAAPAANPDVQAAQAKADESNAQLAKFVTTPQPADGANATVDPKFGTRPLRACPTITSPPTAEQAAVLVQCTMDGLSAQQAIANQAISVRLGAARAATSMDQWPSIDSRVPVVDITGSSTVYLCGPILEAVMHNTGKNCDRYQYVDAPGVCWKNLSGNYKCQFNGASTFSGRSQPPPTTY